MSLTHCDKVHGYRYLNNGAQVALVGRDIETLSRIGEQFPSQSLVIQCDLGIDLQQYVSLSMYQSMKIGNGIVCY